MSAKPEGLEEGCRCDANERTIAHHEIAKEYPAPLIKEGEVDVYDASILSNLIREREFEIISVFIFHDENQTILDYGCGPGWLSKFLTENRLRVVGIEINSSLLKHARHVSPGTSFVTCDGHALPFRDGTYDSIIGISILHHLKLDVALGELKRVAKIRSNMMFMEPNPLNFLSAFGRRFFPTEAHTVSEKPFLTRHLTESLRRFGLRNIKVSHILFMSFPLARLYKIRNRKPSVFTVRLIGLIERLIEKVSVFSKMGSTSVVQGVLEPQ